MAQENVEVIERVLAAGNSGTSRPCSRCTIQTGKESSLRSIRLQEHGEVWSRGASLFHVGHGKVTRIINYWDRDHARGDLGLGG